MRRLVWLLLVLAGCYEPPSNACGLSCTTSCPPGLTCQMGVCLPADGSACKAPSVDFAAIDTGARHACGLTGDGDLYCWGSNDRNQLGLGPTSVTALPVPTRIGFGFSALAVGATHTCALRDGKAFCWGQNEDGQALGGHGGTVDTPTEVTTPAGVPAFTTIAAGTRATCAIGSGQLWCWGNADAIGDNGVEVSVATRIGTADDWAQVSLGQQFGCGTSKTGEVRCWGANQFHQADSTSDDPVPEPRAVALPNGRNAIRVFAGHETTCATASDQPGATQGELYCWGRNDRNSPAPGNAALATPTQIGSDTTWTYAATTFQTACGVRGGQALCWGTEDIGGLGDGFWTSFQTPLENAVPLGAADEIHLHKVPHAPPDFEEAEFACMRGGGAVSCWGEASHGELGLGYLSYHATPIQIRPPTSGAKWTSIVAGSHHACGTLDDDSLWCWGSNLRGTINASVARGDEQPCLPDECNFPRPTHAPAGIGKVDEIVAGFGYTCTREGPTVHCWGNNDDNALGVDDGRGHNVRTVMPPSGTWTAIYGGNRASCGVTAGGLACWGHTPAANVATPTYVMDGELHDPRTVGFGDDFMCMVRTDNVRACAGHNDRGQLGDMGTFDRPTAAPVDADVTVASVNHGTGCEIKSGAVLCWGDNSQGQAGQDNDMGGFVTSPSIIAVELENPIMGCTAIAVGDFDACAICGPGSIPYCWGDNSEGELGRGMFSDRETHPMPVAVPTGRTWTQIAVGNGFACALDSDGHLYCWGDSSRGEVGDGSEAKNLPTLINP